MEEWAVEVKYMFYDFCVTRFHYTKDSEFVNHMWKGSRCPVPSSAFLLFISHVGGLLGSQFSWWNSHRAGELTSQVHANGVVGLAWCCNVSDQGVRVKATRTDCLLHSIRPQQQGHRI